MSRLDKILNIDQLHEIQQGILKIIPTDLLLSMNARGVCYVHDTEYIFEHVPELANFFNDLGLDAQSVRIGANFALPRSKYRIHIDPPNFARYSINIPIINCENTYMRYFKSLSEGEKIFYETSNGKSIWALYYKPEECELLDTHHTNSPYVLDMRTPHQFDNSMNDTHRYMLVCRVIDTADATSIAERLLNN